MRRLLVLLLAAPLLVALPGFAADLIVDADRLGAGQDVVAPCGSTAEVQVVYTTTDGTVRQIAINQLPATCVGATALVQLVSGTGVAVGTGSSAPVVAAGSTGTATIVLPEPWAAVADAATARFVLNGPVTP